MQLGIGLVVGMTGAVALTRVLQTLLQVSTTDPVTLAAVLTVLLLVGLGASLVPARRAMRVDPVVALRAE